MVFGTLLCRGSKAILRIELSLSSLRPINFTIGKFRVALQKRIVRLISKAHYLANTAPLFSKLKVLDIYSINSFSVATFCLVAFVTSF